MNMENTIMLFAPNLISICIDDRVDGDYKGRLIEPYGAGTQLFFETADLLLQMDELYDRWNYPQKAMRSRSFIRRTETVLPVNIRKGDFHMNMKKVQESRGKKGTFIVQVQYRQNATWQGQVVWAEENRKEYFRSALELLKLIDSAMGAQEEKESDSSAC